MATSSTNVHHVVGVEIDRINFETFHSLRITLVTADGGSVSFDAFSNEVLAFQDVPARLAPCCNNQAKVVA